MWKKESHSYLLLQKLQKWNEMYKCAHNVSMVLLTSHKCNGNVCAILIVYVLLDY